MATRGCRRNEPRRFVSADKLITDLHNMQNRKLLSTSALGCGMIERKVKRRKAVEKEAMRKQWSPELIVTTPSYRRTPPCRHQTRSSMSDVYYREGCSIARASPNPSVVRHYGGGRLERGRMSVPTWTPSSCDALPQVFDAVRKRIYRTFGEIVVQLEKRILLHVFPDADEVFYGSLSDIRGVIWSEPDFEKRACYTRALDCRVDRLRNIGWSIGFHLNFGSQMIQKYGVGAPAFLFTHQDPLVTHAQLARLVARKLPREERIGMLIMLTGLLGMALDDGRPLFLRRPGEEFETM